MATFFYIAWVVFTIWAIVRLLLNKREPSSTISWLFFVIFVPIVGALTFLVFGPLRLERKAIKRKKEIERKLFDLPKFAEIHSENVRPENTSGWIPPPERNILKLFKQISDYTVTAGNRVDILPDPDAALTTMQDAINGAKHFIHLEYYIIASDEVTEQLFDHLLHASERGVEIRILYDALGSLFLKRRYFKDLVARGVKIAGFLPFTPLPSRINFNFRNHRKILIVDGNIAFTGGTNIGKEYLGKRNKDQWRDFSVHVRGPVVRQLQDVFAKDWQFTTKEDLYLTKYYPAPEHFGNSIVQMLESGPDTAFRTLHQALFLAINSAQEEILLTTPYFIPDSALLTSLVVAALRGVDVKILLPLKSDSKIVQYASRSFYDTLLQAGATIYEYEPTILHAKLLCIDKKWTMIGSANMDIRSFRLNFELNLLVYGAAVAEQAIELFNQDLLVSKRVGVAEFMARPTTRKLVENACRLLSPIL